MAKQNEKVILKLMKSKKYRGNVMNYAVLTGHTMMDIYGTYEVARIKDSGEEQLLLVHKKHLHYFIDKQQAAQYWNRKLHIRVPRKQKVTHANN